VLTAPFCKIVQALVDALVDPGMRLHLNRDEVLPVLELRGALSAAQRPHFSQGRPSRRPEPSRVRKKLR
jgi:hypothetical protein